MANISNGSIARTIALGLVLINQVLAVTGHTPLDISEDEIYQFVSVTCTIVASVVAWWKNNSFTKEAIMADEVMSNLKSEKS